VLGRLENDSGKWYLLEVGFVVESRRFGWRGKFKMRGGKCGVG
jgi:hypothetical protein